MGLEQKGDALTWTTENRDVTNVLPRRGQGVIYLFHIYHPIYLSQVIFFLAPAEGCSHGLHQKGPSGPEVRVQGSWVMIARFP